MKENKQIEALAATIYSHLRSDSMSKALASLLYGEGWRKQSEGEWIKYPHGSGIYCSLCKHKRRYRDIHDAFCPNCGAKTKGE